METMTILRPKTNTLSDVTSRITSQLSEVTSNQICYICGNPATHTLRLFGPAEDRHTIPGQRFYCKTCAEKTIQEQINTSWGSYQMRTRRALENALDLIEKQGVDMYDANLRHSVDMVRGAVLSGNHMIGSQYEAGVAIMLTAAGEPLTLSMTARIGERRQEIDMVLRRLNLMLEIDGNWHEGQGERNFHRDQRVLKAFPGATIIRIDTAYLDHHIRQLHEDLLIMSEICREIRMAHGGYLPPVYQTLLRQELLHRNHPRAEALYCHVMRYLDGAPEEKEPEEPEK